MNLEQLISQIDESRSWFLKLVSGLTETQWDARAYPNTKTPKETLAHLVIADRCMPDFFSGKEPDYDAYAPDSNLSATELLNLLNQTHKSKLDFLREKFAGANLDMQIQTVYSGMKPIWVELVSICHEDWYHIGQVSLIRQGTDPEFDYYATFYS